MSAEDTWPPQRRAEDNRIEKLVRDVEETQKLVAGAIEVQAQMKKNIEENTEITTQVRDLLTSFRMLKTAAVWVSSILAAVGAGVAGWHQIFKR